MADHFRAFLKKNKISATCACFSVCCSLLTALLIFLFPHPLENLNNRIYDWKLRISHSRNYSPHIVHVDIDDPAIKEYGQWPWDRSLRAKVVEKLSEFGARVIAFDIFYSAEGKSKQENEAFFEAIKRAGNLVSATGLGTLTDMPDKDKSLELHQDCSQTDALYDAGWPLPVPERFHLLRVLKLRDDSAVPLLPIIQTSKGIGHITAFFERMTRAILKHQGRIHQFLGDGFLAVFGDLAPLANHAEAAFAAAVDMQKEMKALNSQWASSGIPEFANGLSIRVGINTGMVFVGDLGADRRLEYTIVGSAVNIASRLQSLAPPGGIMLASRTRALLKDPNLCRGPEKVKLKGFERYLEVYTVDPESRIREAENGALPGTV